MENASFVGEGRTGATSDSPARNGIRRSRYWLSDFLVRRVLAHRCTSQRIWFTRFKQGPQAHRPLRFAWKNNFDPWALRIFGRHSLDVEESESRQMSRDRIRRQFPLLK